MSSAFELAQVTLAVLAGGRGERMGHPKSLLQVNGVPILQFLLDRWKWPGPTMLITAPGRLHPPGAELFQNEYADPDLPPSSGPLRGVHTALAHTSTPQLIVVTVDMPSVESALLTWMSTQLHAQTSWLGLMLARPSVPAALTGIQLEPFPFACRAAGLPAVESRLASGRLSVVGLSQSAGFAVLPAPHDLAPHTWTNLNTPADYAAFIAAHGPPAL